MKNVIFVIGMLLLSLSTAFGIKITIEKGQLTKSGWRFKKITGPSRMDIGESAKLYIQNNKLADFSDDINGLIDGCVSSSGGEPRQAVFLANRKETGGQVIMDLKGLKPLTAVNSYSFHEFKGDDGARGPQVYTLYISSVEKPDFNSFRKSKDWKKAADIDTRPNKTGRHWEIGRASCRERV